eukprot:13968832-Heterocapsa_arctica.AAC.1
MCVWSPHRTSGKERGRTDLHGNARGVDFQKRRSSFIPTQSRFPKGLESICCPPGVGGVNYHPF